MPIPDLFSRRQRLARGDFPDVYQYERIPERFRVQAWHIITDALGIDQIGKGKVHFTHRHFAGVIKREYGITELSTYIEDGANAMSEFFLNTKNAEHVLDIIELYFQLIISKSFTSKSYRADIVGRMLTPKQAVDDLNARFRENGIGYQFEAGQIIRLDSNFLHAEAVKPALAILSDSRFSGANEEFLVAHEHYRHGRYEECIVFCGNAFESTMKTICDIRRWTIGKKDNASVLIDICLSKGLLPTYFDSQLNTLGSLLTSGVPTVRNKEASHGQGIESRDVPEFMARYVLNLTATTILFLAEANIATDNA